MGDSHKMVVNNISEVIGRKSVTFHDDKVVFGQLLLILSINNITDGSRAGPAAKSDSMCLSSRSPFIRFVGGDGQAYSRIRAKCTAGLEGLVLVCSHVILGAEAPKRFALMEKTICMLSVDIKALGLCANVSILLEQQLGPHCTIASILPVYMVHMGHHGQGL